MWVDKKKYEALVETSKKLLEQLSKIKNTAFLIDIKRENKQNIFVFCKNGETWAVRTKADISDDFGNWRKVLLNQDD